MAENSISEAGIPEAGADIAGRIAARALAKREAVYATEVRKLLDAALLVIQRRGTDSRPRVADIVAAAGLSNDAFYRHFSSKDALVEALMEEGTERLFSYLDRRMSRRSAPAERVREWVEGVLSQGVGEVAANTRAVMWNAGGLAQGLVTGPAPANARLATLLHEPFAELGCAEPESDALLAAHATVGALSDALWHRVDPTPADIDRVTAFCLRAAGCG
ncbi:MAG: TetR/AcrR family transcriptional regulator [Nocardia sp.]|nr:TetR/AcrR family transcriptional regulator [Nocardia sp.]